jgi:hypothetical protein
MNSSSIILQNAEVYSRSLYLGSLSLSFSLCLLVDVIEIFHEERKKPNEMQQLHVYY